MRALALAATALVVCGCGSDRLRPMPQPETPPVEGESPLPAPEAPEIIPASTCQTAGLKGRLCLPGTNDGIGGADVWVELVDCHGQVHRFETESRWTGEFALGDMPVGEADLHVEANGFSAIIPIYLSPGRINIFEDTTGQATCTAGPPPRAALIEGKFDPVKRVLDGLGLNAQRFTTAPTATGASPAHELLSNFEELKRYDVLFLACGDYHPVDQDILDYHAEGQAGQPLERLSFNYDTLIHENVRRFLELGRDVYVSDWHWPFVEMLDPTALDFHGDDVDATETLLGYAEDRQGEVEDPALATFLARDQVLVRYDFHGWAIMDNVGANVTTHVRADIHTAVTSELDWAPASRSEVRGAPLVVSFKPFPNGGRVIFTTFHLRQSADDVAMRTVLEYLLFKL
jgi:hypothetical protein